MRTVASNINEQVNTGLASLALCWQITKRDGTIIRGTEHDRDLVVDTGDLAGTYASEFNINGSDLKISSDLSVDNLEVDGATDQVPGIAFSVADVESGILDGARVVMFLVDWNDPDAGQVITKAGYLGAISRDSDHRYKSEVRGLRQKLSQQIGQNYSEMCNVVRFGDARCKFDVASITQACVVESVTDRKHFTAAIIDPDLVPLPTQIVRGGEVQWTSGANTGFEREVKGMTVVDGVFTIELYEEAADEILIGDTLDVIPGCDRIVSTCAFVYDNLINYRGYGVFVPGVLAMQRGNTIVDCTLPTIEPQPPAPTIPGEEPSEPVPPGDPGGPAEPGGPTPPSGPIYPGGPAWAHGGGSFSGDHQSKIQQYEAWIGHRLDIIMEYFGAQTFNTWTDYHNFNAPKFIAAMTALQAMGRHTMPMVLSLAMIPQSHSNKQFRNPGVWDQYAAGDFNDHIEAMVDKLVSLCAARGRNPNTIYFRLGWEMSGDWYPWAVGDKIPQYKTSWGIAADIIRSRIPGAVMSWEPARRKGGTGRNVDIEDLCPAASKITTVGRSLHDSGPFTIDDATWNLQLNGNSQNYGLNHVAALATSLGKKLGFSEWSPQVTDCDATHLASPNGALFISKTYDFFVANQSRMLWDTFFTPGCCALYNRTTIPAAVAYKARWGGT